LIKKYAKPLRASLINEKTIEIIENASKYTFRTRIPLKKPEISRLRIRAAAFTIRIRPNIVTRPLPAPLRSSPLRAIWEEIPIARAK
jgi:hypothetical protein